VLALVLIVVLFRFLRGCGGGSPAARRAMNGVATG
jgi:hypothetical protein